MVTCCHLPVCPSIHPYGKIWRHGKHVNVIGHEWHRAIGNSAAGRVLSCVAIPRGRRWSFEGKRVEVEYEKWRNRTWKSQMEFPGSLNRVESVIYFLTQYWQYITLPIWELDSFRQQKVVAQAYHCRQGRSENFSMLRRKLWGAVSLLEEKPRLTSMEKLICP